MRFLCLHRICPTLAPTELLFQKAKDFFDLLPDRIKSLDLSRCQLRIIGQQESFAVFDDQYPMVDFLQVSNLSAIPIAKCFINSNSIKKSVFLDSGYIFPTASVKQIQKTLSCFAKRQITHTLELSLAFGLPATFLPPVLISILRLFARFSHPRGIRRFPSVQINKTTFVREHLFADSRIPNIGNRFEFFAISLPNRVVNYQVTVFYQMCCKPFPHPPGHMETRNTKRGKVGRVQLQPDLPNRRWLIRLLRYIKPIK